MLIKIFSLYILFFVSVDATGQPCPQHNPVLVSPEKVEGSWFEVVSSIPDQKTRCIRHDFQFQESQTNFGPLLTANRSYVSGGRRMHDVLYFLQQNPELGCFMPMLDPSSEITEFSANINVVFTFNSLALIHFCQQFEPGKLEIAWILSRDQSPDEEDLIQMQKVAESSGINLDLFLVNHENCSKQSSRGDNQGMKFVNFHKLYLDSSRMLLSLCLSNAMTVFHIRECYRNFWTAQIA